MNFGSSFDQLKCMFSACSLISHKVKEILHASTYCTPKEINKKIKTKIFTCHFHLSHMLMLKNPCFSNSELKLPFQTIVF